jgi:hypothetical protein
MNTFKNILIILILVLGGYPLSKLAIPLFSKLFMGYPQLENTVLYEGTVEVKGDDDCNRSKCPPPAYFVTTDSGTHEIYWGLPGDRKSRYSKNALQGVKGKFWFDPNFGVVQEEFILHAKNPYSGKSETAKIFHSIHERRDSLNQSFNYLKYLLNALPFFIYLIVFVKTIKKLFFKTNSLKD